MYKNNSTYWLLGLVINAMLILGSMHQGFAQRKMETLDRGLVAVKINNGVFTSWRILGDEWQNTNYNIYRNGQLLNNEPLIVSNYTDPQGTLSSAYTIAPIVNGVELEQCLPVYPLEQQYKEINLKTRNTSIYEINDATTADLDGDGAYEIIVKRIAKGWNDDNTNYSYFEAYKLDGTFMWEINVGPNILPDVEINIAAFDFDEDGKAEVFMRSSEGTIFGDGTQIGDTNGDGITNYRFSVGTTANMQYMNQGPEFLSLIDGLTGTELDRVDFIPRINSGWWWPENPSKAYGHRASKYFFGAPYLDGKKPSLFIGRGIYTKTVMRTYNVVNNKLELRWEWSATSTNDPYYGQGNHNYTIADVDGDGRDEIVWGSMAIDDDGTGLYSTQLGHGDAMHIGDLDPFRKGIEAWRCLENSPVHGTVLHDAATGEILIHHIIDKDCGRCCAANISDDIKGTALWGGAKLFSASTLQQEGTGSLAENFRIYWDGDLLEELLDHVNFTTDKGYGTGAILKHGKGVIFTANGATSCNYTKGTPSLQADLFGDWREEVVWRNQTNTAIRIYTTINPTPYRNYTLMHDHQYRQAICWQMCGYNQPPHVSYFLGQSEGFTTPPPPAISNNRLVYNGNGIWDKNTTAWLNNNTLQNYTDGSHVLFDITGGNNYEININENIMPGALTVNSPGNCTINAQQGKLSGTMQLVKQGQGQLTLNGNHDYTGKTEIWAGQLIFNGNLQNSPLSIMHFGELYASGNINNGVNMRFGSILEMGRPDSSASLQIGNSLIVENGARIVFDLYSPENSKNDSLIINGKIVFNSKMIFVIKPHLSDSTAKLPAGTYHLATIQGQIQGQTENIVLEGITGTAAKLKTENNKILLEVRALRQATSIEWNGDKYGSIWDFAETENFTNNGMPDIFVDRDEVKFTDNAQNKTVNITGSLTPASIIVNATEDYIFDGTGNITGNTGLTKTGSGTLTINNTNTFTGKVAINQGTIEINKLPNNQSAGAIGVASANAALFEINGGTLLISSENNSNRAINLGQLGGTISNTHKVVLNEAITGDTLTKTGIGNLVFAGPNTHKSTIITEGTITLLNDETNPGQTIIMHGGTLQCNDNSSSYSTLPWNIEVADGKTANIKLDSRAYYTGNISGNGTLNMYIPFVRSDLNGDMTAFTGTLNCLSSSGSEVELRINHYKGLPNAHLVVNNSVSALNVSGTTIEIGALSGTGTLNGDENYKIGSKDTDSQFDGIIAAGSLTKSGDGVFTLTNNNTYAGPTVVNRGTLFVANKTGSATGTGDVNVKILATLSGDGIIGGNVTVDKNATIAPGSKNTGKFLSVEKSVTLKDGSTFEVKTNPSFNLSDYLKVNESITVSGKLKIINTTTREYFAGNEFKIFDCENIYGTFEAIYPETPGDDLIWNTSELYTKGIIKVEAKTSASILNTNSINVFPNPFNNNINIENRTNEILEISISTLYGKTILQTLTINKQTITINLGTLNRGVYLLKAVGQNNTYYERIIKQQ